jgi:hypothetical protein
VGSCVLDSYGSGYGPVTESCKHCNESSGSVKVAGNFFTNSVTISVVSSILFHTVSLLVG